MHLGTFLKPVHNVYQGQKVIYYSTYESSSAKTKLLGDILILEHFREEFLKRFVNTTVLLPKKMFCSVLGILYEVN